METQFDLCSPDEWENDLLKQLRASYSELKRTHAGRSKRPVKFVDEFQIAANLVKQCEKSSVVSVKKERGYLINLLERLNEDYRSYLSRAESQRDKNAFWEKFYDPAAKMFEGGKADGNSR